MTDRQTIIDTLDAAAEAVLAMRATRHYANEARLLFVAANQIRELKRTLAPHPDDAAIATINGILFQQPTENELSGEDG